MIIRKEEVKKYTVSVDKFYISGDSPHVHYPLKVKLCLKEDLEIYKFESEYYPNGKYFTTRNEEKIKTIYTDKTPKEARELKLYNGNDERFFLFNGNEQTYIQSDSSGTAIFEILPNYKPKNIPLDINDVVEQEICSILLKEARVGKATIKIHTSVNTHVGRGWITEEKLSLEMLIINEDDLSSVLSDYLNRDFNQNIKTFTLYLRDIDSRVDLPEVKLKIKGENIPNQPQHNQDFARLFKGDLLKYVESLSVGNQFKDYVKNEEITFVSGDSGKIQIPVYLGAQYSIELIHPKYNFAQEKITFDTRTPNEIPILMSELGTKVRLEILKNK